MTKRMSVLTATTAIVSCLSLVAPGATLAQSNANASANAGKDKLPVCAAVEEDVPCREPGKAGKVEEGDGAADAAAGAGKETTAEAASDTADAPKDEPKAGEQAAEDSQPAEAGTQAAEDAKPSEAEIQAAEDAKPAEDETQAAEDAQPAEEENQTAEPAEPAKGDEDTGKTRAADSAKPGKKRAGSPDDPIVEQSAETAGEAPVEEGAGDAPIAEAKDTAPGNSGETPAAMQAEGEPEQVEEKTVTEQTARSSDEEFETSADADADVKADAKAEAEGGGGDGGLSNLEKFAIGAAGLVALDALLDNDDEVVTNSGDRVVVRRDGELEVFRDDNELLRRPGSDVRTETYSDGSTRTVVTRENGTRIVTVTDGTGRVLRRTKIRPNGTEVVLVDDTRRVAEVDVRALPQSDQDYVFGEGTDEDALRAALRADAAADLDRGFSLYQVRSIPQVRELMPEITVDAINFRTDSAAIRPREADELRALGLAMRDYLDENPDEVFLIEGHTDAVGDAAYNLALSDRRAESVALALTEYFDVPPENMVIQGYGERLLRVDTQDSARENRRAAVRRITPLLEGASG